MSVPSPRYKAPASRLDSFRNVSAEVADEPDTRARLRLPGEKHPEAWLSFRAAALLLGLLAIALGLLARLLG